MNHQLRSCKFITICVWSNFDPHRRFVKHGWFNYAEMHYPILSCVCTLPKSFITIKTNQAA